MSYISRSSMDYLWNVYGLSMDYPMDDVLLRYGSSMDYLWITYGLPMEYRWNTYELKISGILWWQSSILSPPDLKHVNSSYVFLF